MWDWAHFSNEGWWNHTKRSSRLAGLLILATIALVAHIVVPFWQQSKRLRVQSVVEELCSGSGKKE